MYTMSMNVYLFLIGMYCTYMCMMHMYTMYVYGRDLSGLSEDKKVILLFSQFHPSQFVLQKLPFIFRHTLFCALTKQKVQP